MPRGRGRPRKTPKELIDMSCPDSPTGFHKTFYKQEIGGPILGNCKYCDWSHTAKNQQLDWADNLYLSPEKEEAIV